MLDTGESNNNGNDDQFWPQWNMITIYSAEQLAKDDAKHCETDNCGLLACVRYQEVGTEKNWDGCLDCQGDFFQGWPKDPAELPDSTVLTLSDDDKAAITKLCCRRTPPEDRFFDFSDSGGCTTLKKSNVTHSSRATTATPSNNTNTNSSRATINTTQGQATSAATTERFGSTSPKERRKRQVRTDQNDTVDDYDTGVKYTQKGRVPLVDPIRETFPTPPTLTRRLEQFNLMEQLRKKRAPRMKKYGKTDGTLLVLVSMYGLQETPSLWVRMLCALRFSIDLWENPDVHAAFPYPEADHLRWLKQYHNHHNWGKFPTWNIKKCSTVLLSYITKIEKQYKVFEKSSWMASLCLTQW
jgi:hypothetical protein